jgi:subtilisin family serine protease
MQLHRTSRATVAAVAVTLLLISLVVGPVSARRDPVRKQDPTDSWIVMLQAGVDAGRTAPFIADAAGGRVGHVYRNAFDGFQFIGSRAAAEALTRNPNVRSVVADRAVELTETLPFGVERIDAYVPGSPGGAYQADYRGSGARIAVIDTGIDLDHPDLALAIDLSSGKNCVTATLPPNDGHGHGSHVAGSAAAPLNGVGVVGVAPQATLVPVKVFDDAGNSSEAQVLCGLDHAIGFNTDGDPMNDVDVASMSFGESRAWGDCVTDPLHQAICAAAAAGMVLVGGSGNSSSDADSFVPAAFPEVISVSAIADFDGDPGGLAGCGLVPDLGWFDCDDTFAFFSNYGLSVDVIAPGVAVNSTWKDGGYSTISGTSMATPHVSGVAALMKAVNPALTGADVLSLMRQAGECPSGVVASADGVPGCVGQGTWPDDPDGTPEPLVNALKSAQLADGWVPPPPTAPASPVLTATAGDAQVSLTWSTPAANGSPISGYVVYRGTQPGAATQLASVGAENGYVDSTVANGLTYYYQVAAVNDIGESGRSNEVSASPAVPAPTPTPTPTPTPAPTPLPWVQWPQGDWVGNYGADGYALLAWNGTSDLIAMPSATLVLDQGRRSRWSSSTTSVRALEDPSQASRRAAQWVESGTLRLHMTFGEAYSGTVHLYAVDWDGTGRRQRVYVDDGSGEQSAVLNSSFHDGAWMHFPVSVAAAGTISIRAELISGQTTLSGIFLGEGDLPTPTTTPTPTPNPTLTPTPLATPTPPPTATPQPPGTWEQWPQGDWVGTYGVDGYALLAWNKTSDVVVMPGVSLVLDQGRRTRWSSNTTSVRALENATQTQRCAAQWVHGKGLRLHLTFDRAYGGTLHLYAVDWDGTGRRQTITVNDGAGPQSVVLGTSFHDGAWMHFSIQVPAGGSVTVQADVLAGQTTLSGIFLGGS